MIFICFQLLYHPLMERCHFPDSFFQLLIYFRMCQHLTPVFRQENEVIENRVPCMGGCTISHLLIIPSHLFSCLTPSTETGGNLFYYKQSFQTLFIKDIDIKEILKTFQNVAYIGMLRQRWEEIKKLSNPPDLVLSKTTTPTAT